MGVNINNKVYCYSHSLQNSLPFQEIGKQMVHQMENYKLTELKEREIDNGWN